MSPKPPTPDELDLPDLLEQDACGKTDRAALGAASSEDSAALDDSAPSEPPASRPLARNVQERVRTMPKNEALKRARNAGRSERSALERRFGKEVWEALLSNPRITPPEVAAIARKGTVPLPLIERIASNGSWLGSALVRRALLSNPKLPSDAILRVLRRLPKTELKLAPKQTGYPNLVRQTAKKLLGQP